MIWYQLSESKNQKFIIWATGRKYLCSDYLWTYEVSIDLHQFGLLTWNHAVGIFDLSIWLCVRLIECYITSQWTQHKTSLTEVTKKKLN